MEVVTFTHQIYLGYIKGGMLNRSIIDCSNKTQVRVRFLVTEYKHFYQIVVWLYFVIRRDARVIKINYNFESNYG